MTPNDKRGAFRIRNLVSLGWHALECRSKARELVEMAILITSQSCEARDRSYRSSFFSHPPTPKNRSDQKRRGEDKLDVQRTSKKDVQLKTEKQKKTELGFGEPYYN